MYINKIETRPQIIRSKSPAFGAKINLKSPGIAEYCEYLERCKNAPKGCFSSNRNIALFSKICKAFENHPSEEVIDASVTYLPRRFFNARGVLETNRGKITDVEPSRSDDGTGPMEYLFRKLLHPDNKKVLNGLLGKEHSDIYPKWWDENIKPIWNEISDLYKIDDTIEHHFSEKEYNSYFRTQFKKKRPITQGESNAKTPFFERLKQAWNVLKGN